MPKSRSITPTKRQTVTKWDVKFKLPFHFLPGKLILNPFIYGVKYHLPTYTTHLIEKDRTVQLLDKYLSIYTNFRLASTHRQNEIFYPTNGKGGKTQLRLGEATQRRNVTIVFQ